MSWSIDSIPAKCITLERRPDRWRRFQGQPGIMGLDLRRFNAVDGKTIDVKSDNRIALSTKRNIIKKYRRSHEELDSVGGIGCALSHIALWQWMVDTNQEILLVFEDDAKVPDNFIKKANDCIKDSKLLQNPDQWDIWLLGGSMADLSKIPDESKAVRVGAFYLLHAYVITKHAAERLLKEVYPIHCHIDIWISIFSRVHDLRMVTCKELNIEQNTRVKTDIQSETGCDVCDIPKGYSKTHTLITKNQWMIAQASEVLLLGLVGYLLYRQFMKNKD